MDDNILKLIMISIIVICTAIIIAINVYKKIKQPNGSNITIETFIEMYSDNIIMALQNVIYILQLNINDYPDKESYEKDIINKTISSIKENCVNLGINENILNLFNLDTLTEIVQKIFFDNEVEVFSILNANDIMSKKDLYDKEVINVLGDITNV